MSAAPRFAVPFTSAQSEQSSMLQQQPEAFDDEAFARAFDAASRAEIEVSQELEQQQETENGQNILINESAERLMESDSRIEHRLGADLIHDPSREEQEPLRQDDPDALARTAALLLDSVSHNQSDKFQNSQFLELMRQLRDKEVTVEGDKIVGTAVDDQIKVAAP